MGRSSATGGSTRISQSPTPRSVLPVVEVNVWEGTLFETVRIFSVALGNLVHRGGVCQLRAPRVKQLLVQWQLFGWREMGERMADHFRHPGLNAIELLKPVRMSPELVHGPNVLAPQHCPGDGGQIEISNRPCAGIIETGHRMLLSLAGGGARISQPP